MDPKKYTGALISEFEDVEEEDSEEDDSKNLSPKRSKSLRKVRRKTSKP